MRKRKAGRRKDATTSKKQINTARNELKRRSARFNVSGICPLCKLDPARNADPSTTYLRAMLPDAGGQRWMEEISEAEYKIVKARASVELHGACQDCVDNAYKKGAKRRRSLKTGFYSLRGVIYYGELHPRHKQQTRY